MGQKMSTRKSGADNFQPSVQVEDLHNVVESDSVSRTSGAFSDELLQNEVANKTHKTSQTPLSQLAKHLYMTEAEIVAALRGRLPKHGEVPIYILIGAQVVTVGPSLHATRHLLIGQHMTLLPIIESFPYYMEHIQCTI